MASAGVEVAWGGREASGPAAEADARVGARRARLLELLRWSVLDVAVPFAGTRLLLSLIGMLALGLLPLAPPPGPWTGWSQWWIDIWSRWDGRWYLSVVRDGYSYLPGEQSNVAFSPLLPLLMRAGGILFGRDYPEGWVIAGIVVANLGLIASVALLFLFVRREMGEGDARRAALYLLLFPSSLFLSALYADSLFLALSLGSMLAAGRRWWWLAGGLGALGALTRPHGFLLLAPLGLEYLASVQWDWRRLRLDVLALGLVPAAVAAWAGYLWNRFGDPLAFLSAQAGWGRALTPPWETLRTFLSAPLILHGTVQGWDHSWLDLLFVLGFGALVVAAWKIVRPAFALYATLLFFTIVSNGVLAGAPRYGLALFPAFMVLAFLGRRPAFHQAYLVSSSMVSALLMALFALGYWVA